MGSSRLVLVPAPGSVSSDSVQLVDAVSSSLMVNVAEVTECVEPSPTCPAITTVSPPVSVTKSSRGSMLMFAAALA